MNRQYTTSKPERWTEVIWISGMTEEDYNLLKNVELMEDRKDGGILYTGTLTGTETDPIEVVLCTETDHPTLAMFGWVTDVYEELETGEVESEGAAFFDLGFFERVLIPQAREVGIWDVHRDLYAKGNPEVDWERYWDIMNAISRAWSYPTDPDEAR